MCIHGYVDTQMFGEKVTLATMNCKLLSLIIKISELGR